MKYIIIGLGHFGSALAEKLALRGHEVIGVDKSMDAVEAVKDKVTRAICLNAKDQEAVQSLPLRNADVVIVCIGEAEGENIMTTALLKKIGVKRLISRSVSPLHEDVLEAMGIHEILRPEIENAERWAIKLSTPGVLNLFEITPDYQIIELVVPPKFAGQTVAGIDFNHNYNVVVLTKIRMVKEKNMLGFATDVLKAGEIVTGKTVLEADDIIVVYGHKEDLQRLME
jgi:trk system potassium uptake protein TrkA